MGDTQQIVIKGCSNRRSESRYLSSVHEVAGLSLSHGGRHCLTSLTIGDSLFKHESPSQAKLVIRSTKILASCAALWETSGFEGSDFGVQEHARE